MANGPVAAGTPEGPRCGLRSSAAVAACVIDGAWMKPLSLAGVCRAPGSPAGSVVTGFTNEAGIGLRFSTQP